jgi:hypothetical protein
LQRFSLDGWFKYWLINGHFTISIINPQQFPEPFHKTKRCGYFFQSLNGDGIPFYYAHEAATLRM